MLLKIPAISSNIWATPMPKKHSLAWPVVLHHVALLQLYCWEAPRRGESNKHELEDQEEDVCTAFPVQERVQVSHQLMEEFNATPVGDTRRLTFLVRYTAIEGIWLFGLFLLLFLLAEVMFLAFVSRNPSGSLAPHGSISSTSATTSLKTGSPSPRATSPIPSQS